VTSLFTENISKILKSLLPDGNLQMSKVEYHMKIISRVSQSESPRFRFKFVQLRHLLASAMLVMLGGLTLVAETVSAEQKTMVEMSTNKGVVKIELFDKDAPESVKNFIEYVESGFYDGLIFHRVIPGFMIQGGGFEPGMQQKETRPNIKNEANNGLKNEIGTLAMARTPDPHSASSQFFINIANNEFLNFKDETPQGWGYAVFGKVAEGMDVVDMIAAVETGQSGPHGDVPKEDIVIESAKVVGK